MPVISRNSPLLQPEHNRFGDGIESTTFLANPVQPGDATANPNGEPA